jgi:hypothetical protein
MENTSHTQSDYQWNECTPALFSTNCRRQLHFSPSEKIGAIRQDPPQLLTQPVSNYSFFLHSFCHRLSLTLLNLKFLSIFHSVSPLTQPTPSLLHCYLPWSIGPSYQPVYHTIQQFPPQKNFSLLNYTSSLFSNSLCSSTDSIFY